ncbi:hypothetical protein M8C21_022695 [Ambrosia artemisiifolia]|uniref:Secreted protein n=1 Tax=Ambrosia artemisiifolia TaxID=4212 RepID=A0AAD5C755_AMBAR|nr:hypothetical protein M8C21_022695 [Ambrosia artemisiifolia]
MFSLMLVFVLFTHTIAPVKNKSRFGKNSRPPTGAACTDMVWYRNETPFETKCNIVKGLRRNKTTTTVEVWPAALAAFSSVGGGAGGVGEMNVGVKLMG